MCCNFKSSFQGALLVHMWTTLLSWNYSNLFLLTERSLCVRRICQIILFQLQISYEARIYSDNCSRNASIPSPSSFYLYIIPAPIILQEFLLFCFDCVFNFVILSVGMSSSVINGSILRKKQLPKFAWVSLHSSADTSTLTARENPPWFGQHGLIYIDKPTHWGL